MEVIEVIPYKSFKERLKLMKNIIGKGKIIVYDSYIYFERIEGNENYSDGSNNFDDYDNLFLMCSK